MKSFDELKSLIERRGVHAEFGATGEGWGIEQSAYELAVFLVRMQELGVTSVLEIGTGYKGGLSRFLAADMRWKVTTVDVVKYEHPYESVVYRTLDTLDDATVNGRFDLLFIDGDHRYEAVKHDYNYYVECATKAVAFHDILGLRGCEGAAHFWHDLQGTQEANYKSVWDKAGNPAGIGWIEL